MILCTKFNRKEVHATGCSSIIADMTDEIAYNKAEGCPEKTTSASPTNNGLAYWIFLMK